MDILFIVHGRLNFIERFYNQAAHVFKETKRKIGAGEEPYRVTTAPEDYDGPEFLNEWIEADADLRVLGQCALGLVEKALHDYLREFTTREGGSGPKKKSESWFDHCCRFLEENTQFAWAASPVSRSSLEQINLSRNDAIHDPSIDTWPRQSEHHFLKHPTSRFADQMDLATSIGEDGQPKTPVALNVTDRALTAAIDDVKRFCAYVEAQRTRW